MGKFGDPGHPKGGRPVTYRSDAAARILDAVSAGTSIPKACEAEHVPIGTLYEWADSNREGFGDRLEQAETEALRHLGGTAIRARHGRAWLAEHGRSTSQANTHRRNALGHGTQGAVPVV